jgi:hypothetical protein
VVRLRLLGANIHAEPTGLHQLPGYFNYFIGNDPSRHAVNVPRFAEVRLSSVYPRIDLRYYFDGGQPRFDFIVQPGADPSQIRFSMEGAEAVYVKEGQTLAFRTRFGEAVLTKLYAYQGGHPVESRFVAEGGTYRIAVGAYDPTQPLVIDPLVWSTFLGGSQADEGSAIAIDASGCAYIAGGTESPDFPATPGAYDTSYDDWSDAFVTKLSPTGNALIYSTFLGGSHGDVGNAIAVDASGYAYITGGTGSTDFPTTPSAYDQSFSGVDAFVTKLSPTGNALIYSTFLGGGNGERAQAIAIDASGCAYITGWTESLNFPTTPGAYDLSHSGGPSYGPYDAFVTKLSPTGNALIYSTFLGGIQADVGNAIAVDASGYAYITGSTYSPDFPTTPGAYDTSYNGGGAYPHDAFVTKLSPDGSTLLYSTFLGGSSAEGGYAIAIDASGSAYITGTTLSSDFPTTSNAYDPSHNGSDDVFVTKLSPNGDNLVYSTLIGGSRLDHGSAIAIDGSDCAYITGSTDSTDFPTTPGAYDSSHNGGFWNAFVTKLSSDGSTLLYSTFLGGSSGEEGFAIAIDGSGSTYITGRTLSTDFPTTPNAYDPSHNGYIDVFVTKLSIGQTTPIAASHSPTFLLHPNPTRGAFTIETPTGGTFELLNTQGQRLRTYTLPAGTHTLHEPLPAGTYLLHETRSGATSKLLIQP